MEAENELAARKAGRVVLAHEAPFVLSGVHVNPGLLQIEQQGRTDTLEPRVMQVLVALAQAEGQIVTREDLIERCWHGRVVGEDALNRALSRLRHYGSGFAGGSFSVETIPRVGYRLIIHCQPDIRLTASSSGNSGLQTGPITPGRTSAAGASPLGGPMAGYGEDQQEPHAQAVSFYLRGMESRGQNLLLETEQSVSYFREATRIDPNYAAAWGALAWAYRTLLVYDPRRDGSTLEAQCKSAAKRALRLDPDDVDGASALLFLKPFYGRWEEVEAGCRSLLNRHPGNSVLTFHLGLILLNTGRSGEAVAQFADVAAREKFWPVASWYLSRAMLTADMIEEAEAVLERSSKLWPRRTDFWIMTHRMLLASGRIPDAATFANDLTKRPAADYELVQTEVLAGKAVATGLDSDVQSAVAQILALLDAVPILAEWGLVPLAILGVADTAFEMLQGYYFGVGTWARLYCPRPETAFLFSPSFRPLREDERFPALLGDVGLTSFWQSVKQEPDFRRFD